MSKEPYFREKLRIYYISSDLIAQNRCLLPLPAPRRHPFRLPDSFAMPPAPRPPLLLPPDSTMSLLLSNSSGGTSTSAAYPSGSLIRPPPHPPRSCPPSRRRAQPYKNGKLPAAAKCASRMRNADGRKRNCASSKCVL